MIYNYLRIDKSSSLPIWKQILEGLENFCRDHPSETPIPSERDLAHNLQVSRTTLRQALKEACEQGLIVIRWAKGIYVAAKKDKRRILIIMPDRNDITCPWNYIIHGILQRADELKISIELITTSFLRSQEPEQLRLFFTQEKFTGILHMDYIAQSDSAELEVLRCLPIPVLFPHTFPKWAQSIPFPVSCINLAAAVKDGLQALAALGHRRILTLTPYNSYELIRGYSLKEYAALLSEIGADPDPELICTGEVYNSPSIPSDLRKLVEQGRKFTAIFCFSDYYAMETFKILKQLSLRVPDDISVMGFCGYPGGKFLNPGLSTIDFHYHDIGRTAVDRLLTIPADWQNMPADERLHFSPYDITLRHSIRKISSKDRR